MEEDEKTSLPNIVFEITDLNSVARDFGPQSDRSQDRTPKHRTEYVIRTKKTNFDSQSTPTNYQSAGHNPYAPQTSTLNPNKKSAAAHINLRSSLSKNRLIVGNSNPNSSSNHRNNSSLSRQTIQEDLSTPVSAQRQQKQQQNQQRIGSIGTNLSLVTKNTFSNTYSAGFRKNNNNYNSNTEQRDSVPKQQTHKQIPSVVKHSFTDASLQKVLQVQSITPNTQTGVDPGSSRQCVLSTVEEAHQKPTISQSPDFLQTLLTSKGSKVPTKLLSLPRNQGFMTHSQHFKEVVAAYSRPSKIKSITTASKRPSQKPNSNVQLNDYLILQKNFRIQWGGQGLLPEQLVEFYNKKLGLKPGTRVFIFNSQDDYIRRLLLHWGWFENKAMDSPFYTLKWAYKDQASEYASMIPCQYLNHFRNNQELTSKGRLLRNIRTNHFSSQLKYSQYFPKCYDLGNAQDIEQFNMEYEKCTLMILLQKTYHFISNQYRDFPAMLKKVETRLQWLSKGYYTPDYRKAQKNAFKSNNPFNFLNYEC